MNSHNEKELLDDLFHYGLAPYQEAKPAPTVKNKILRMAEQRRGKIRARIALFPELNGHLILHRILEAFREEPVPYPLDPRPLIATNLLNRHILAVRLY